MEICPLVWWVQIWDFWFQPPCLCETQSRWTDDLCMCGSHREAWRRCEGVLCCWHRLWFIYYSRHTIPAWLPPAAICHPSWFALSGTVICFSTGQWPNTPPGCVRAILPRRRVMECCIRWPGLHNHLTRVKEKQPTSAQHYVGTPSRLLEKHSRWLPHEAAWENTRSVQSCHQGNLMWLLWRIWNIFWFV